MIFRAFLDSWAFVPSARKGRPINCDKNLRLAIAVFSRLRRPNGAFGRTYIGALVLSIGETALRQVNFSAKGYGGVFSHAWASTLIRKQMSEAESQTGSA